MNLNLCNYAFLINEVLAMHMHKEHNGAAPVQKSCNMCLLTFHLSGVLKNHISMKHLGILKTFERNKYDFSAKSKGVPTHFLENARHLQTLRKIVTFKAPD